MSKRTPGYVATADGRVYSEAHNWRGYGRRELKQELDASGYPSVRVTIGGKRTRLAVHRIVANQFLPPRPSMDHEIRHLNGNRTDCRSANLAWGTRKENAADRSAHGRTSCGAKHSAAIKRGIAASLNSYWRHAR